MKVEDIIVGNVYYIQCRYNCKSCYRAKVIEILDEKTVLVQGLSRSKKGKKEAPPYKISISALHKSSSKATSGYRKKK